MTKSRAPILASLKTILIYYDGPQLLHLKSLMGNNMVAVAVDHSDVENMFFGCEVRDKDFSRYIDGQVDLLFLFNHAMRARYYLFDGDRLPENGGFIELSALSAGEEKRESFWPKPGLFSRSHTQNPANETMLESKTGQQSYAIDGRWEATDFSRFYGKMADLYGLFAIFDETWDSLTAGPREKIANIIRTKMFQGGGSYVGFYDQIYDQFIHKVIAPLRLSRISYASPGQVDFNGDLKALDDILTAVENNQNHKKDLARLYSSIRGKLKRQKLLRRGPMASFASDDQRLLVKSESDMLASRMGIENTSAIFEASEKNTLVYAKIVLSIYRRLDELSEFQAEGRVIFRPTKLSSRIDDLSS